MAKGKVVGALAHQIKVAILTAIVIISFLFSSLAWRHIETNETKQIIIAAAILIIMYVLMIFELVNRNLAALIGAAASVAAYDCLVEYVEMHEILQWEDLETLSLLFGMMIIVNVLSGSGLFNFLAVWSYKKSGGRFWLLVFIMSLITAFLSAFIDNVSTMLLMSPTLIKLGELEHMDPRYLLIIMVICSNIGGCATPVGDPPNLIIIGDPFVSSLGITFSSFVAYCGPCVLLTIGLIMLYLRLLYKSKDSFRLKGYEPPGSGSVVGETQSEHSARSTANNEKKIQDLTRRLKVLLQDHQALTGGGGGGVTGVGAIKQQSSQPVDKYIRELQQQINELETNFNKQYDNYQLMKQNQLSIEMAFQGNPAEERRGSRLTETEIVHLLRTHSIKSKATLVLSLSVLSVTILLFFVQSLPDTHLTLGWISLFAGLTLLVASSAIRIDGSDNSDDDDDDNADNVENHEEPLDNSYEGRAGASDISSLKSRRSTVASLKSQGAGGKGGGGGHEGEHDNFELVINNIEWSTLLFFFALFIVMEVMAKLGLIHFVGSQIISLIDIIPEGNIRSVGAISIVLWASGIASACIDNVPFTSMMIKVLGSMAASSSDTPIKPLVFALAFGACYGGNGTLIGASANLVTAGLAGRFNYPISFNSFFKFSAPITVISLAVANIYLVLVFVVFNL